MNRDAYDAHLRLMSKLPHRDHIRPQYVIPQGGRVPEDMKAYVRTLLKTRTLEQVADMTGLARRTVGRIRDEARDAT